MSKTGLVLLERGRVAFNRGEYFEAHEVWEEVWRELAGVERVLMQGLIQIAAGLHHLRQHRPRPAASLLRKGIDKVSQRAFAPPVDLPVHALARDVAALLEELESSAGRVPDSRSLRL